MRWKYQWYNLHANTMNSVSSNIPRNCGQVHFYAPKENNADNDQKTTKYDQ